MFSWDSGVLYDEQEAAIEYQGNVFLSACPGSGKTRTLTYKAAYELANLENSNQRVIAITYTNKAADEIRERIELMGVDISKLWIGTIHSFCLEWILRPYALYHKSLTHGFRVINSYDSEKLLTELSQSYKKPNITYYDCGYFCTSKGYHLSCSDTRKRQGVHEILQDYFQSLIQNNQIDYELILYHAYELIRDNPSIRKMLNSIFSNILVDEYQDTKEIQYQITAAILNTPNCKTNIFIVGDPNQAIYGSLGGYAISAEEFSKMANISIKKFELSRNYRSSEKVINYFDYFKITYANIESHSDHKTYSSRISFNNSVHKDDLHMEIERLIKFNIESLKISQNEICVIAPWWIHLASMTRKLVSSMPEYDFNGPGMVPFSRDIENFWYGVSKIALTQASPMTYVKRLRWANDVLKELENTGLNISHLTNKLLLRLSNKINISNDNGLEYLASYFDILFKELNVDWTDSAFLSEHYTAFFQSSYDRIQKLKKEGLDDIDSLDAFKRVFGNRNGITISSIHGVKGGEFDTVIAYGLLEGMVPHFTDSEGDIAANKMLYVIASRAKKNLHLFSETGRQRGSFPEYQPTNKLSSYGFVYDKIFD